MTKFKAGDVVRLPSGGAKMTVTGQPVVDGRIIEGFAVCVWHDAGGRLGEHTFPEDALVKCDADGSGP
jgi:uncharacterized protein YodC (DUF2158 family)